MLAASELDDLDEYRARADRFLTELEDEHYRRTRGLDAGKDDEDEHDEDEEQ